MSARRLVLAACAATLLVAAALVAPAAIEAQPEEALEASSVTGPIASAIDAGVAPSLAGLLPTSEQHQRVSAVANGLKDGIPPSPPSLDTAQLADITAIAAGAAGGAVAPSPNTLTTSFDKAALRSLAKGYMEGALAQMADAPGNGRAAIDQAVSKGVFTAAASLLVGDEPALAAEDLETYGRELAEGSFREMDKHGAAFAQVAGSPALADITLFSTALVRGQLETLPTDIARAQLEAVATFGAGALDGMVVGVVTQYPQGAPLPAREDIARWIDTLARGHEGTAPWKKPSALPLLLQWADGVAAGGIEGIAEARRIVGDSAPTPPSSQAEIEVWAEAVTRGGFERVDDIPTATTAIENDVRAYAMAVTSPAVELLASVATTPSDPELVAAWAFGLTAGVEDVKGASVAALGLSEDWLAGLATAATALPVDATGPQAAMVKEFAEGVTEHLTVRMDNITRAALAPEDAALIGAMAEGIAEAAVALGGAQPLTQPQLAEALGGGIASGFLETKNPQRLFDDVDGIEGIVRAWVANGPPASLAGLNALAQGSATRAYYAASEFGQVVGGAPVDWAAAHGAQLTPELTGTVEDALWMATFAKTFAEGIVGSIDPANIEPTVAPVTEYASRVLAQLPDAQLAIQNVTKEDGDLQQHAFAFASYLSLPAEWVRLDPDAATVDAATAAALAALDEADDVERFTDATYVAATLAYLDAIALGLVPDKPGVPENGEYLPAWVAGMLEAHEDLPTEEIEGDLTARLQWVTTSVTVVGPLGEDITASQLALAEDYAEAAAAWALSTPDHLPDAEELDTPLLVWADATIATALERLPPSPTEEESEVILAYLEGIARAVTAVPDPTEYDWTKVPNQAAIDAYLTGITSGIDRLDEELAAALCAGAEKQCPEEPGCGSDCPPPDPDPEPEPEPCADDGCRVEEYAARLTTWAGSLASAIDQLPPDITATREGVALVETWALQVLGGHGVCRPDEAAAQEGCLVTGDCDDAPCASPRGPVAAFVGAEHERIEAAAEAIGAGLGALAPWQPQPGDPLPVDPANNPVLGWAAGLTSAIPEVYYDPTSLLPTGGNDPLVDEPPMGDPTDAEYRQLLYAWANALWDVPAKLRGEVFRPFPNTEGINATVATLDSFFAESVYQGGALAILDTAEEIEAYARQPVPDVALDAWALGLGQGAHDTLVDPTQEDLQALLFWYAGAAQGGVDAILAAGDAASTRQVPILQTYAERLVEMYAPPAPPELDTVEGVFTPGGPKPPPTSGGGDEEPEETPGRKDPTWLEILQAYAAGMADAALAAPVQPTVENARAYQESVRVYVEAIAAAASEAPPASPDAGYPARLRAWVDAEATAALASPPTSAERATLDPDVALALAYLEGFASTSPWNLEKEVDGHEAWARSAVGAALATECPKDLSADACAQVGAILGEATGIQLPQEAGEVPLPSDAERVALLAAVSDAAAPVLAHAPEGAGAQLVIGLVAGLVPGGVGEPDVAQAAAATAQAVGGALDQLPFVAIRPTAEQLSAFLVEAQEPARYQALAAGAVALVVGMGDAANDPALVQQRLAAFLGQSGSGGASISVSDGERTRAGDALDGSVVLDGFEPITITAYPAASSPTQASWELRWSASDPRAAGATRVAMTGANGVLRATLAPGALAGLDAGAQVRFVVVESAPGRETVHDRAGSPYSFVPDRDAPTASVTTGALQGASVSLTWTGADGGSQVESYRVETRDGEGAWTTWMAATAQKGATFTGAPGHSYTFRVTATDAVGHIGAPATSASVPIPADAPADRAPVVAFAAPAADAVFGKSIEVTVTASDPDGTQPVVRLCVRADGVSEDLACPYEGDAGPITLDASRFADGRYRLHATASDGTLTATAQSAPFTLDRAPPAIRGAAADPSPLAVLLSASVEGATNVVVDIGGRTLALSDDGRGADARAGDGTWTADAALPAGEHTATFRATDASGNEARIAKTVVVPAAPPPGGAKPGAPSSPGTNAPPTTATPPAQEPPASTKGTPGAGFAFVVMLVALLALVRRRR